MYFSFPCHQRFIDNRVFKEQNSCTEHPAPLVSVSFLRTTWGGERIPKRYHTILVLLMARLRIAGIIEMKFITNELVNKLGVGVENLPVHIIVGRSQQQECNFSNA